MRRKLLLAGALVAAGWLAFGAWTLARRAPRAPAVPGELRGAWHVHTTRSDGLGTLDEVVRAAKAAGLQFVVVADHNVLAPSDAGYRDGVLVIVATEISSAYGHVVAVGLPEAPGAAERADPFGRTAAAGGAAVLAHPLHPRRPFTGWGRGEWRGFEVSSNDSFWYQLLQERSPRLLPAALALPFDAAQTVLWISRPPVEELSRFDAEVAGARAAGRRLPALLCSADAHGYPGYRAAFEAFSMHVPVTPTGDAAADTRAVLGALLDGRATCVYDGVAPASGVAVSAADGGGVEVSLDTPRLKPVRLRLIRDGREAEVRELPPFGPARVRFCPSGCGAGVYRVEGSWDGRPWIFTNPVAIE